MTTYTFDELKEKNGSYHEQHRIAESDVELVNTYRSFIEGNRNTETPQVGDIVEYTSRHGDYYQNAHIEQLKNEQLYICESPYTPFVSKGANGQELRTSTSGGAWHDIPNQLKKVGERLKTFQVWGHSGACANGTLQFEAFVNVWEYEEADLKYTTKHYDKFHVTIQDRHSSNSYRYTISKGLTSHTAFKTEVEYQAWLKTFGGIEIDGFNENNKIVWTLKQETRIIPRSEYDELEDAIEDSELLNGVVQEVKRSYQDTRVITYRPYQNTIILLDTIPYKVAHKQLNDSTK